MKARTAEFELAGADCLQARPRFGGPAASKVADGAEFRFEVAGDLSGLREGWNALAARCASSRQGFQSFAWMQSWAAHYVDEYDELRIVLGYSQGELALIWPLGALRRFGITTLRFLGEPLCQYNDVLIDDEDGGAERLIAAALDFARRLPHDVLTLRRVREDSILAPALVAAGARVERRELAPFIDFGAAETFEAFERTLCSKARSDRRRRRRQIEKLGAITFESPVSIGRKDALIATAMAFKREWALKGGHYAPAAFDPRFERCFHDAAREQDPEACLRVFAMLCDGRPIGVEISLGYKRRLFGHVLAPDPALAKFGLGNALADAAIEDAFARGYQVYDLLAPASPYKAVWTKSSVEVMDFTLTANARGAFAHAVASRAVDFARALAKLAPPAVVGALMRKMEPRQLLDRRAPRR